MRLTPQRLAKLTQSKTRYIIYCESKDQAGWKEGCSTGFFSHYLRAIYGIRLAIKYNLSYYVDYGCTPHLLSDSITFPDDANFWNYYFDQPTAPIDSEQSVFSRSYETWPVRIWNRSFLAEMNRIVQKHVILRAEIAEIVTRRKPEFEQNSVLGVHIRRTDHFTEIEPVPLAIFKQTIQRHLQEYDKIFIATDDQDVLDGMLQEFGSRILFNDVIRSRGNQPIHEYTTSNSTFQIGLDALTDAYCLSFCCKLILVHSNLSYASLLLNPTVPYILLETRKHQLMRWKTLGAYHFDRLTTRLPAQ